MAIVKKISVDNLSGSPEERDIGAEAQNVSYSEEESVKDKLDQHETHVDTSVVSENGVHGLRIHDDILQSYDKTEEDWVPVSTGYDVPAGGTANQGLVKASVADNDTTWADVLLKNGSVAADNVTVGSRRSDVTTGLESLTMGLNNAAAGRGAQAQGVSNNASGNYSHAEGQSSSASGVAAHAEGSYTVATGNNSHAEGDHTEAGYAGQHVTGKYNDNKEDTLFEVGNGTLDNARSNAFEVTSDGYIRTHGNATKIAFGVDNQGRYGYIKAGADTVTPFKGDPNLQTKLVTPTTSAQTISPDSGYDGLSSVSVGAIQTQTKSVTLGNTAQIITPDTGKYLTSVNVPAVATQQKTVTLTGSQQNITPDSGYNGLSKVVVPAGKVFYKEFDITDFSTEYTVDSGITDFPSLIMVVVSGENQQNNNWPLGYTCLRKSSNYYNAATYAAYPDTTSSQNGSGRSIQYYSYTSTATSSAPADSYYQDSWTSQQFPYYVLYVNYFTRNGKIKFQCGESRLNVKVIWVNAPTN